MADLRGVFHAHSTWSDGTVSIAQMAEKAMDMGLTYLGLSDHSKAAAYANGLDGARLEKQWAEIDLLNKGYNEFRILKGLECDILADGSLDLTPEILSKLDFVIGSVHSRFEMPEEEMTTRICNPLANKHLHILGHATGRLLLTRPGYKVDMGKVIDTAARCRKVIELNSHPHRLDLNSENARRAADRGVMVSINPDAHSPQGIEDIEYGVMTARRAGLTKDQVLNTRPADEVLRILREGIG